MLAVTAGTLGPAFAVGKTLAAVAIGLFGGAVTFILTHAGLFSHPVKAGSQLERFGGLCETRCGTKIAWRFWREAARRTVFWETAWITGRLMLTWLTLAFVAEYFLVTYLPLDWLPAVLGQQAAWAIPLATLVGMPIYLDGYAALPLIRGLMDAGMGPGAAMAFLIAGGITSAWAAIPVFALVRLPVFGLYLLLALVCALLSGWAYGILAG